MNWRVDEAKQNLSKLLHEATNEPQMVYSRDRLMAAVISPELYAEFESWREGQRARGSRELDH